MKSASSRRRSHKVFVFTALIIFILVFITIIGSCGETDVEEQHGIQNFVQTGSGVTAGVITVIQDTIENEEVLATETEEPVIQENEDTEESNETPVLRENTLYYVIDEGYRYDCPYEYQDYLWKLCTEKDIEQYYELLLAQMYHESGFNPSAESATNDSGIMQINESNHEWLGKIIGDDDFLDPYTNMDAGVYLMATYLEKYQDVHKALVCYNMGEGKVINDGIYESEYSHGVVEDMEKLIVIEE